MITDKVACLIGTWLIGLLGGTVAAALLWVLGGWTFMQGAFVGFLVFLIGGAFLNWTFCKPLPPPNAARAPTAAARPEPEALAQPVAAPAAPAAARTAAPAAPAPAPEPEPAKPVAAEAAKPAKKAASKPAAKPKPSAKSDDGGQKKPRTMKAPRKAGPDDLKKIKGVGPKLEKLLHSMGFYHFDQIAKWTGAEVAWVDDNLEGFKGRVSRDDWVAQAKLLADGGETEFSSRVGKGDVY